MLIFTAAQHTYMALDVQKWRPEGDFLVDFFSIQTPQQMVLKMYPHDFEPR